MLRNTSQIRPKKTWICWVIKTWRKYFQGHMKTWNTLLSICIHLLLNKSTYTWKHYPLKRLKMSLLLRAQPSNTKLKNTGFTVELPTLTTNGVFKASIMETLQSLRDEIKSVKKPNSKVGVDRI